MTQLQSRAQHHTALETSSSPPRSVAHRAQVVSSVCPEARRAKSPLDWPDWTGLIYKWSGPKF